MLNSCQGYSRMSKPLGTANRSRYVTSTVSGERVRAFVPAPLPPDSRTLALSSLPTIVAEANQAVGRLDGDDLGLPGPESLPILLRPQGGGTFLSN